MVHRPQASTMTLRVKWMMVSGAALLLLLILGVLSYRRLEQEAAAQQWFAHTHQVMEKLDATLANSLDPDLSRRGIEINSQFDSQTIAKLEADISSVRSLTADNPRQQKAIAQLTWLVRARNSLQPGSELSMKAETIAKSREL